MKKKIMVWSEFHGRRDYISVVITEDESGIRIAKSTAKKLRDFLCPRWNLLQNKGGCACSHSLPLRAFEPSSNANWREYDSEFCEAVRAAMLEETEN